MVIIWMLENVVWTVVITFHIACWCLVWDWMIGRPIKSGRTQVSNCNIQQPYGLYTIEPTSPTSLESIRMITLRIKLDTNVSDGESFASLRDCKIDPCYICLHQRRLPMGRGFGNDFPRLPEAGGRAYIFGHELGYVDFRQS